MRRSIESVFVAMLFVMLAVRGAGAGPASPGEAPASGPAVTTYHDDNLRTGWDSSERDLTTKNVKPAAFGVLASVPLDDQVDAQPLYVSHQTITTGPHAGTHDVAYVVTESDTVYAIDAASGAVLVKVSLGSPVPETALPGNCSNNADNIGIGSTPVIDLARGKLYVLADTYEEGHATYRLHALDLASLADTLPPRTVSATRKLSNGDPYVFAAGVERQRAALLENGGVVYAAFASYCDHAANATRGLVLGWQAATLAPLAATELTDSAGTSPKDVFLSAVWMSGFGLAAGETGSIYFATGNSDSSSYDEGVHDIQESVVRISPDLSTLQSFFTPSNYATLDNEDQDVGSGGVMLVPAQPTGPARFLAVAAGKDGRLFVLDRTALGGYSPSNDNVLDEVSIGGCWCGASYFIGSDGVPRIVTSGQNQLVSWRLKTAPSVQLIKESASPQLPSGEDPGFFTTISSNGTVAGSAVAWAVTRPQNSDPADVSLEAIDPLTGSVLFSAVAGTWPHVSADADLVPTVAAGRVFVASFKQLSIFGLTPKGASAQVAVVRDDTPPPSLAPGEHAITGVIDTPAGSEFALRTRTGRVLRIDAGEAARNYRSVSLYRGEAVLVYGRFAAPQTLRATSVQRAKSSPAIWLPDR